VNDDAETTLFRNTLQILAAAKGSQPYNFLKYCLCFRIPLLRVRNCIWPQTIHYLALNLN